MDETHATERSPWPERTLLLLVLGAAMGAANGLLLQGAAPYAWTDDPVRFGAGTFLVSGGIVFAFALERLRWSWSIPFALAAGLLLGAIAWRNGAGHWGAGEGWQFFSALVGIAVAVPLFQTVRDAGRPALEYRQVHAHSWTNAVLWCAACAFVGSVFLLAHLLAQLFGLIGISFLETLLRKGWFQWLLAGGAFGTAVGLLRDRGRVLDMVRRVGTAVLSVLAPILAVGLLLFVAMLPFTGLAPLWEHTRSTTPVVLGAILAAFLLANATIGSADDEEPRGRLLGGAAMGLGLVMLPLGLVAAVSTLKRIGQYGLTPDRLWACVFIGVALTAGLFYLGALLRRRTGWAEDARQANLALGVGVCAIALFLALPILSFGAVSARDQVARLESGRVAPDKLDWEAMRFDYGPAGVAALARLRHDRNPLVVNFATRAATAKERGSMRELVEQALSPQTIEVRPAPAELPPALRDAILTRPGRSDGACTGEGRCLLFWKPGESEALVVMNRCAAPKRGPYGPHEGCAVEATLLRAGTKGWETAFADNDLFSSRWLGGDAAGVARSREALRRDLAALDRGEIAIREVKRRQLFVGETPVTAVFD